MPYKTGARAPCHDFDDLTPSIPTMRYPITNATLDAGDIAIIGRKGSGKTYAAKGLVERLIKRGRRVVVIDPMSIWYGLRHGATPDEVGLPVLVIGGEYADLPFPATDDAAARQIARFILAADVSVVVDVGDIRSPDNLSFVAALINELYETHKSEQPVTVVLEEADIWAPQLARSKQDAAVLREVDTLVRRGRRRGFQVFTITQRPAALAKNILSQFDTLVALSLPGLHDRKAVRDWLEGVTTEALDVFNTLPSLDVGEAWIWTPHGRRLTRDRFLLITTLDTSSTPTRSDRRVSPGALSPAKLQALTQAFQGALPGAPRHRRRAAPTVAGLAIVELRHHLRITQAELAEKIGSEQKSISRMESGATYVSTRILEKIAEATGHDLLVTFRRK